jgi:hypothetical protein
MCGRIIHRDGITLHTNRSSLHHYGNDNPDVFRKLKG